MNRVLNSLKKIDFLFGGLIGKEKKIRRKSKKSSIKKLRNSFLQDDFEDIFEHAPIGYIILNSHYEITKVNHTASQLFGRSKRELLKSKFTKYVHVENQDEFYMFLKSFNNKSFSNYCNICIKEVNGEFIDVRVNVQRDTRRKTDNSYRVTLIDNTVQKSMESTLLQETNKLRKSEEKFRQIVENSYDIFLYQDILTGEIEYLTPKFYNLLGYEEYEIKFNNMRSFYSVVDADDRDKFLSLRQDLYELDKKNIPHKEIEFKLRTKTNRKKWIKASFSLVKNICGTPIQIMANLRDVTESKKYEKEIIKQKNIAEENDRLKSIFLANMSHEIRTPLNGILGFAHLLKESNNNPKNTKYIDIIEKSGKQLLDLINQIIDISKIESGQLELKKSHTNIPDLIDEVIYLFDKEAKDKGLKLILDKMIVPDHFTINIDREKLYSIVANFVKNAIKYTENGWIKIGVEYKNNKLHFYVEDTGIGIPDAKKAIVFERFRQVEETGFHEGVGLGLSIVNGLVKLMGGKIGFKSEEGVGSKFFVKLAVEEIVTSKTEKTKRKELHEQLDLENKSILVAEDDPVSSLFLSEMLKSTKAELKHANDGAVLMDMLKDTEPDFILLDINMPKKSGIECLNEIKKLNIKSKIIAQTAYASLEDKQKFIKLGSHACVSKPINKNELFSAINCLSATN
jgi:PAS domain S-box-containing protein